MKKIKAFIVSLLAFCGCLTGCGMEEKTNTAFVEQTIEPVLAESVINVTLPKKTGKGIDEFKGYVQVKIKDINISVKTYTEEEAETKLQTIDLNLRKDKQFVDAAYSEAIKLVNLKEDDELGYKLLVADLGNPYHDGLALKFDIDLDKLASVVSFDVLKTVDHFDLSIKDTTTSVYAIIPSSRPTSTLSLKWDTDAAKFTSYVKPEVPSEE